MAEFLMEARTKSGQYLYTLPFENLQGEFFFNKPDEIRFEIHYETLSSLSPSNFKPAMTEIWLVRNGTKIFVGPMWSLSFSKENNKAKIVAGDISSYFDVRRVVGTSYSGSFGDIAWQMISETQAKTNGNLFITRGSAAGPATPGGVLVVKPGVMLIDQFDDFTKLDLGFDWNITPERVYNQYYPRINSQSNVVFEFGGAVRTYGYTDDGKYIGNEVQSRGKNDIMSTLAVDTVSRAKYGLMEFVGSNTSLSTMAELDSFNAKILDMRREARYDSSVSLVRNAISPFDGDFGYGNVIKTIVNDNYTQINQSMRCEGYQLTIGSQGEETYVVYLNDMREVT